jgi:hypothetical protein
VIASINQAPHFVGAEIAHDRRVSLSERFHLAPGRVSVEILPALKARFRNDDSLVAISSGKLHQKMLASLLVSAILVAKNHATYQDFKCCIRFPPRAPTLKFVFDASEFFSEKVPPRKSGIQPCLLHNNSVY